MTSRFHRLNSSENHLINRIVAHRPIREHLAESAATAARENALLGHVRLTSTATHAITMTAQSSESVQHMYIFTFDPAMIPQQNLSASL